VASLRLAKLLVLAFGLVVGCGTDTGWISQISLQYWAIVLSEEKKPDLAIPVMAMEVHLL